MDCYSRALAKTSLAVPLLASGILSQQTVDGRPSSCSEVNSIILFSPDGNEYCWPCSECPLGYGLDPPCGSRVPNTTSVECKHCVTNKTFSDKHDISSCQPCHECGLKNIVQNCTTETNRKCGTTCPKGYYYSKDIDDCRKCFYCCSTVTDDERVIKCKDIGMPSNWQCEETEKNRLCKEHATKQPSTPTPTVRLSTTKSFSTLRQIPQDVGSTHTTGEIPVSMTVVIAVSSITFVVFLAVILYMLRKKRWCTTCGQLQQLPTTGNGLTANLQRIPEDLRISGLFEENNAGENLGDYVTATLDVTTPGVANWKDIGHAFCVPQVKLNSMELQYKASQSPSVSLFEFLKTRGRQEPSVRKFVEVLHSKGRNHLVEYICQWPWENRQTLQNSIQ